MGCSVIEASDAEEALRVAARAPIDALLSDMAMPGMSGMELVDQLREQLPRLPCVLMTGMASADLKARARTRGVILLQKPVPRDEMAVAVRRALAGETP
jgi:two-component system response regulator GlrR